MEQAALNYLQKDRLLHIDMLELLRLNEAKAMYAGEDGVLIHLEHGNIHMLSAASEESAVKIAAQITDASMLVLHQPYLREELMARFSLTGCMSCHQAAWLSDAPVPPQPGDIDIRSLAEVDLPFVHEHYDNISDEEYLLERMKAGMLGIYVENELAGFIGTHTEGTIGLLEILPAYRRRGLAFALEGAMMCWQQERGRIPYAQIKEGNEASLLLHKKLGMEVTPEASVLWLY